ncbi:MAG TPA: hypothetical protein VKB27_22085 [Gammaproteobacteria bacterium]|nr:hypothetical protein [Gammaproteobacteria bacterium]
MKYFLLPVLALFSGSLLAHPGHAPGVSDHGFMPLVLVVALVVACLFGYELHRGREESSKDDTPDE